RYRRDGDRAWRESPMHHVDNDRWAGTFTVEATGRYRYTIEALTETFQSWLADLQKRHAGGQDLTSALGEGRAPIRDAPSAARRGRGSARRRGGRAPPLAPRSRPTPAASSAPARLPWPPPRPPSRSSAH